VTGWVGTTNGVVAISIGTVEMIGSDPRVVVAPGGGVGTVP